MAISPQQDAEGVVRVSVLSNGSRVDDTVQLVSVEVRHAANKISSARLVLLDGDMPNGSFPLSDTDTFQPGAVITLRAGYGESEATIFEGIVVRHEVKISGQNDSRLVIECRDKTVGMTVGRHSATFLGQTDGQIITRLLADHGFAADVAPTTLQHEAVVQHLCTDWDFMLARASVNGLLVTVHGGAVHVQQPQSTDSPTLGMTYGVDLIEFSARTAVPDHKQLREDDPTRVQGHIKFQGSAKARVGGLIELKGVGARFNGKVWVAAVLHSLSDGDWFTEVEFGLPPQWPAECCDVSLVASGVLPAGSPGVAGLQIGVVAQLHGDPAGENRVRVTVPMPGGDNAGVWARLAHLQASNGFGTFFVPEVGDEVVLGYLGNEPSQPVILGSLYSSQRRPPCALEADNSTKAIVTRSHSKIEFNDDDKVITVSTPGGNRIVLGDKDRSIVLSDQHQNTVALTANGITLASLKDIVLNARGRITLDAVGAVAIAAKGDVTSTGLNVRCEAQLGFEGKGAASAELSASGQTVVKGAMVLIN